MKKPIFILAITIVMAGTLITGCQSSASKVEEAQAKVNEAQGKADAAQGKADVANQALDQAIKDSVIQFKKEAEARIDVQEKAIVDLRAKIAKQNKEDKVIYEQRLAVLEQQNRDMRRNLEAFDEARKDDWITFRNKFNHDMEAQGKAFRDFWTGRK